MEETDTSYFVDWEFLERQKLIDERNWFSYFQKHHLFDSDCLNIQKGFQNRIMREEDYVKRGLKGPVYLFERVDSKMFIIKKTNIFKEDWALLEVYVVVNNCVFTAANLKGLLGIRVGNIGSSLLHLAQLMAEVDDGS